MLYSLVAAWGMKGLPSRHLATFVFLMIWMRNAIAPVAGSAVYANMLYHKQQHYAARLVQGVDRENVQAAAAYAQIGRSNAAAGKGSYEAEQAAAAALNGRVTLQAALLSVKDLTGNTVVWLSLAAFATLLQPYRKGETT